MALICSKARVFVFFDIYLLVMTQIEKLYGVLFSCANLPSFEILVTNLGLYKRVCPKKVETKFAILIDFGRAYAGILNFRKTFRMGLAALKIESNTELNIKAV